ncbi:TPA: single-stranded DNA-binding protein [Listeria monocytogenes]
MMNRVVLVGRLTKDPELRYTPAGVAVATFTLAVNRTFTNQQGEREADFINCVVWRKPAENVANFLKKGSMAGVDGRVQTRNYEGNDGKRVYVTEIVAESVQFLEPRNSNGGGNNFGQAPTNNGGFGQDQQQSQNQNYQSTNNDPFASDGKPIDISDDDLPF